MGRKTSMKVLLFLGVCLVFMARYADLNSESVRARKLADMKQVAVKALYDCDFQSITNEAAVILKNVELCDGVVRDADVHYERIWHLQKALDPFFLGHTWISKGFRDIPMHIVIRFGDHRLYAYLWLFGSDYVPFKVPEGVELIEHGIYFSSMHSL